VSKGDIHEAVAVLLREKAKSESEGCNSRGLDVLESKIQPLLAELDEDVLKALEIAASASLVDAKKQYRKLVLRYHPDKSVGTTRLFHCVQNAFERYQKGGGGMKSSSSKFTDRYSNTGRSRRWSEPAAQRAVPLQPPQNLRMMESTSGSLTLHWHPPSNTVCISFYEIQFKEADAREWHMASNSLTRNICQKHNLKASTTYKFRVRALNGQTGEWSPFCSTCTVSTMTSIPAKPKILSIDVKPSLDLIRVAWESPAIGTQGIKYQLQWRLLGKPQSWVDVANSNDHEAASCFRMLRNLDVVKAYEFRVKSWNHIGTSPWSAVAKHMPRPDFEKPRRKLIVVKRKQGEADSFAYIMPLRTWHEDERIEKLV